MLWCGKKLTGEAQEQQGKAGPIATYVAGAIAIIWLFALQTESLVTLMGHAGQVRSVVQFRCTCKRNYYNATQMSKDHKNSGSIW